MTVPTKALTTEELKEARRYAWAYFALHADQRMKLFNFFLVLSGAALAAFPTIRGMTPGSKLSAFLPLLLVLAAFVFWRLDERTRSLIRNAESALRFLDRHWSVDTAAAGEPPWLHLFARDDYLMDLVKTKSRIRGVPRSYTDNFRLVYAMIGCLGLGLSVWVSVR